MNWLLDCNNGLHFKIQKESMDHNKSMKTSSYVAGYLVTKFLATHSTGSIGYYLCLIIQT